MYRFLLSPRWLRLLGGVLLAATACGLLGWWQLDRLAGRRAANHRVTENVAAPPVDPARLLSTRHEPRDRDEWRRVTLSGRYDAAHLLLVRNRTLGGGAGYDVLTPLVPDRGPALLVNRGWVPAGPTAAHPAAEPDTPAGPVTVTARVRPSEPPARGSAPPPGQVTRIDVPAIAADLPYPAYLGYAELERQQPAPGTSPADPRPLPVPELSEGPHLAYAVQWFLFAAMALGGFVVLARREEAERHAERVEQVPWPSASRTTP